MKQSPRPKTILIIEDEAPIREMLQSVLKQAKFNIAEAEDAKQAFTYLLKQHPDLILIDWMLPGTSGIEVARLLKKDKAMAKIPLIMLTARATEDNKLQGFATGIDDYIVKPFSPRELIARIHALLRRTEKNTLTEKIEMGDLIIDPNKEIVTIAQQPVKLTSMEYRLLLFFISQPQKIYSRSQLLNQAWPHDANVNERTVDATIKRLRKALGPQFSKLIKTIRGSGYCFDPHD